MDALSIEEEIRQKKLELKTLQKELAEKKDPEEIVYQDIEYLEASEEEEVDEAEEGEGSIMDDEEYFLGSAPVDESTNLITLPESAKGLIKRVKGWLYKGLDDKDEKKKLIQSTPKRGDLMLLPPNLNKEVAINMSAESKTRDDWLKLYQNMAGSALSLSVTMLADILYDNEPDRHTVIKGLSGTVKLLCELFATITRSRKFYILGGFEEKMKPILQDIEPTEWLFGDGLKEILEGSAAVEKRAKDLKPKTPKTAAKKNAINWRSSKGRVEGRQSSSSRKRPLTPPLPPRQYPGKKSYHQSQPHKDRRR